MMLNLKIEGFPEEILNLMVEKKIAANKTEAIRLAVLHYNEHFGIKSMRDFIEEGLVKQKVAFMKSEIKSGKKKAVSIEDFARKEGIEL